MAEPQLFFPGEMGFLNFMIFQAEAEGRIRIADDEIQVIVPDFPLEELTRRWQIDRPAPKLPQADAAVLHYTSIKPTISRGTVATPMTHFRWLAAMAAGHGPMGTWVQFKKEDLDYDLRRWKIEARHAVGRVVKRLRRVG